jgi:hypothetical protein
METITDDDDRVADDAACYWTLRMALRAYEPRADDYRNGLLRELAMVQRYADTLRRVIAHEVVAMAAMAASGGDPD